MSTPSVCENCVLDVVDCSCTDCPCRPCGAHGCRCGGPSDERLDRMVAQASVPNLGALYRTAQQSGLIKPVSAYASTA